MASPEIIIGLPDKHEGFQTLARRFRKAVRGCTSNSELAGGLPKKRCTATSWNCPRPSNNWCLGHEKFGWMFTKGFYDNFKEWVVSESSLGRIFSSGTEWLFLDFQLLTSWSQLNKARYWMRSEECTASVQPSVNVLYDRGFVFCLFEKYVPASHFYTFRCIHSFLGKLTIYWSAAKSQHDSQRIPHRQGSSFANPPVREDDNCFYTVRR